MHAIGIRHLYTVAVVLQKACNCQPERLVFSRRPVHRVHWKSGFVRIDFRFSASRPVEVAITPTRPMLRIHTRIPRGPRLRLLRPCSTGWAGHGVLTKKCFSASPLLTLQGSRRRNREKGGKRKKGICTPTFVSRRCQPQCFTCLFLISLLELKWGPHSPPALRLAQQESSSTCAAQCPPTQITNTNTVLVQLNFAPLRDEANVLRRRAWILMKPPASCK